MAVTNEKSHALTAFMAAALALPGISAQAADSGFRSEQAKVSYHHANYSESGERMKIRTDQVSITLPFADRLESNINLIRDITSGASPVVNFLDIKGNPHLFLETGASIRDRRDIYEASLGYYGNDQFGGVKIGRSLEDDYESRYVSVDYRHNFNQKLTTLSAGIGYNNDDVWNSYNSSVLLEEPTVYKKRKKNELTAGISQILDRNTVLQWNLTSIQSDGALSDPYKKAYIVDQGLFDFRGFVDVAGTFRYLVDNGVIKFLNESGITQWLNESPAIDIPWLSASVFGIEKDNRPSQRQQWISTTRLSHYFASTDSALHVDYRYADDDWDANSQTLEFKWNIDAGMSIQVSPGLRYYSQQSAFFYDTFFETLPTDGYVSSDYRLAGFGAITHSLEVSVLLTPDVTLFATYEDYDRRHDYEVGGHSKGAALDDFSFKMASVSVDAKF